MRKKLQGKAPHTNESGYMLITVVLIITIIAVLGVSVIGITKNSVNTSTSERSDQSAFYIAEAGMTVKTEEIKEIVNETDQSGDPADYFKDLNEALSKIETPYEDFEKIPGEGSRPYADIAIDDLSDDVNDATYRITSTGNIGKKKRKLQRIFTVSIEEKEGIDVPELVLFVKDTIELGGNGSITGNIGTMASAPDNKSNKCYKNNSEIIDGNATLNGSICYGLDNFPELSPFPKIPTDIKQMGDLAKNSNYTLKMEESLDYNDIEVKHSTLTIDTGNSPKDLLVENLNVNKGHIKITGTGQLNIYVTGELSFGSNKATINDNGDINDVNIYLWGSKEFKLTNGQKVFGTLYTKDANVKVNNKSEFQGTIAAGGDVQQNGGTVKGTVIANSYKMTGGELEYDPGFGNDGAGGENGAAGTISIDPGPVHEVER